MVEESVFLILIQIIRVLITRLNAITETMFSEAQNSFVKGRSCLDCTFTIAQLTEKRRSCLLYTSRCV